MNKPSKRDAARSDFPLDLPEDIRSAKSRSFGVPANPAIRPILQTLMEGNRRHMEGWMLHPRQDRPTRIQKAKEGQNSPVVIVSCADSRVAPEVTFDGSLGDFFTVRAAGNVVLARGETESLSLGAVAYWAGYALERRRPALLMVLWYCDCGACRAAATLPHGHRFSDPSLEFLVETVRANIPKEILTRPGLDFELAAAANARSALCSIIEHSPTVRQAMAEGLLATVLASYHAYTGAVTLGTLNGW
ncbi:MAG: hypothetical protein IT210_15060 [Armatimonadetes bacterium]|nr:hypothetical protein [Armatimonadota bacterium]